MSAAHKPLIGISCCTHQIGLHPFNIVGEKYILAVAQGSGGLPLLIPAIGEHLDTALLLDSLDGILFTGSPSNVEPHHYNGAPSIEGTLHDPKRDAITLPLIKAAVAQGIPVLGVCRGFQEMNVAFGGTLHQRLHEVGRYIEHRENKDDPVELQYGLSHQVHIEPGGLLFELSGRKTEQVNSVHTQGVDQLAPGLRPEATAPDGLIEAFSVSDAPNFALGVQWHPEWKVTENPFYLAIFKAFGDACRTRSVARRS
ncbi:MAG: gamma-glutamyl-gamma-aminobutyrate hydrolase [Gammaproteobacteria bacterium HGW-Gammaproteobacteria-11]|nr:MAG: gamma-glutamyl-gamma-aminobutyrate hydrolase [Gammaproteobacteria bacterium HGW-Gammaproteobacteria-11]